MHNCDRGCPLDLGMPAPRLSQPIGSRSEADRPPRSGEGDEGRHNDGEQGKGEGLRPRIAGDQDRSGGARGAAATTSASNAAGTAHGRRPSLRSTTGRRSRMLRVHPLSPIDFADLWQ